MIDNQFNSIVRRVRETLGSGHSVAVVGWRDSNHSRFTRQLPQEKIIFLEASAGSLPERVDFVLFTRFVTHEEAKRAKINKSYHPIPVEIGLIKKILKSCEDLLVASPILTGAEKPITVEPLAAMQIPIAQMDDEILDFLTTPKEKCEMNNMEKLAKAFLAEAEANRINPGHVGKTIFANMRRDFSVEETPQQLVNADWIIGEVGDNKKKVGSYKAGPKMLAFAASENSEPEDRYELAKFLVAQKDKVLAEKAKIEEKLARIEQAERVLEAVAALK